MVENCWLLTVTQPTVLTILAHTTSTPVQYNCFTIRDNSLMRFNEPGQAWDQLSRNSFLRQSWSKLSRQFVLFPLPPLQCWFFTVSKIKIRSSIAGMFQHCLGGRGAQKRQRKKNKRCSYNDGSVYSKFSTFRPKFDKCPEVFWPGL